MSSSSSLLRVRRLRSGAAVLTPAKINLFLEIVGERPDGFHELKSLILAVDWHDWLAVFPRPVGSEDRLRVSGEAVPATPENLAWRALEGMRGRRPIPPVDMLLHKRIPPGSGLGGGSGNAAGMLALMNTLLDPGLCGAELAEIGAEIGSDVPFFLGGSPGIARGRGEIVDPFKGAIFGGESPVFLLILPYISSSTADAYRRLTLPLTSPVGPITFPERTFDAPGHWVNGLFNRLEGAVLSADPRLRSIARWLQANAPGRWRMTGSGSAFYVACRDDRSARELASRVPREVAPVAGCQVRTRRVRPRYAAGLEQGPR
ncbi:MAG: 4-(cytidine 5'-diphospho)-2-C-methyl-D-erythritol kinase [Planctomycetota bacterium]